MCHASLLPNNRQSMRLPRLTDARPATLNGPHACTLELQPPDRSLKQHSTQHHIWQQPHRSTAMNKTTDDISPSLAPARQGSVLPLVECIEIAL